MASNLYLLLETLVYLGTIIITSLSAYYVYRQSTASYRYIRNLLILVHLFYAGAVVLEMLRAYVASAEYMVIYTIGVLSFILFDVVLLTFAALTIYLQPSGTGYKDILRERPASIINGLIFAIDLIFIFFVDIYLILFRPFYTVESVDVLGVSAPITVFDDFYLLLILVVLILFILYPSTMLLLARRRVSDKEIRLSLMVLPAAWIAIGTEMLIFNGYLLTIGIDATAFGYLFGALAFSLSAVVFSRATVLVGFFELKPTKIKSPVAFPFSNRLPDSIINLPGTKTLLEVDSSSNYENAVEDFTSEILGRGYLLFIFTSKGSSVYNKLVSNLGFSGKIKFYILNDRVSYPKATERVDEILVPLYNQPVLLDVVDKTLKSATTGVGLIIDSVSDLILSMGFQKCYQFLKLVNEKVSGGEVASMFLITSAGHDENTMALVRGLFANQLSFDSSGLRKIKWTESE